jgi:hypothetical protein
MGTSTFITVRDLKSAKKRRYSGPVLGLSTS